MSKLTLNSMVNGFKAIISKGNNAEYFGKKFTVISLTPDEVTINFNGIISTIPLNKGELNTAVSLYKVGFTILGNDNEVRTVLRVSAKVSRVAAGYRGTHLYKWLSERGFAQYELEYYKMANVH